MRVAYTIEGIERSGERSLVGIEPNRDKALEAALDAEGRGLVRVTITSAIGWKYSVSEFAEITRRELSHHGRPAHEMRASL
jgi:hypothetical protein